MNSTWRRCLDGLVDIDSDQVVGRRHNIAHRAHERLHRYIGGHRQHKDKNWPRRWHKISAR